MLKRKIREAAMSYDQYSSIVDNRRAFVAGAIFALNHQWISVKEALPDEAQAVIAHSPKGHIDILTYIDESFWDKQFNVQPVDYWMKIPNT